MCYLYHNACFLHTTCIVIGLQAIADFRYLCYFLTLINRRRISINKLPAGANVPFVHSHKNNEEIYGILSGKGSVVIDDETIDLSTGDWLRIGPSAKRQFFAAADSDLSYVCIQVKENSLGGFTADDAVIY